MQLLSACLFVLAKQFLQVSIHGIVQLEKLLMSAARIISDVLMEDVSLVSDFANLTPCSPLLFRAAVSLANDK